MTFDVHQLDQFLLLGSAVTLLAILAVRVSSRAGLPSLLIYLLMGVALGESGFGIPFEDAELAHALGFAALVLILAEGGVTTHWNDIRGSMRLGVALATIGVAISVTVVALASHYVLGLSWEISVLLGACTSATDAAAVFSVLRVVPLPKRLTGTLEAESGLNDAPTVVLVTLISTGAVADDGPLLVAGIIVFELVAGVLIGLAVGFGGAWLMRRAALPSSGLYPLAVLCLTLFAYAGGAAVHASGFAAVYVAALVLGNSELPHRAATRSFAEGVAWLAQIGLFVMLGLLLSPGRITLETVGLAIAAGLVLTLVARPLSVLASTVVQRMPPARAGVPVLGRAAWGGPDRVHHDPARGGGRGRRAAVRPGVRDGRDLHHADRPDPAAGGPAAEGRPALGAARPRPRSGTAGTDRGRPAADHDQPGLQAARCRGG